MWPGFWHVLGDVRGREERDGEGWGGMGWEGVGDGGGV